MRNSKAVTALEYGILTGVIAVGTGIAIEAFTGSVSTALQSIGTQIESVSTSAPDASGPTP